jgi:catechol 2,3-dioxygenase-like lactoylglutathione lyase family enzyme
MSPSEQIANQERGVVVIDQVQIVSVPVSDQERAKNFYVNTLGFEVREDTPFGEGMRWIEVAPEDSTASLALVTWFESMPPGSLQGLVVATDDIQATYDELVEKDVPFDFPPSELPGGTQAVFRDLDGNGLVLWERQ